VVQGGAWCWGRNDESQVGSMVTTIVKTPSKTIDGSLDIVAVAAGENHSCALLGSGEVRCWGANLSGSLGDGTETKRVTPVSVLPAGSGTTQISAGTDFTCIVRNGSVRCWGADFSEQLGDGGGGGSFQPWASQAVAIFGSSGFPASALSAGHSHACAIVTGAARCWGNGEFGKLGNGDTAERASPTPVSGFSSGSLDIAAGHDHSCVRTAAEWRCWGHFGNGALGDGSKERRMLPVVPVTAGAAPTALVSGEAHTCVVIGGAVRCWGSNGSGQVGDWTFEDRYAAVDVVGINGSVIQMAAAGSHTCALTQSNIWCWGSNTSYELGAQLPSTFIPSALNIGAASAIAAGSAHTCVVMGGGLRCWGSNRSGQLGDPGSNASRPDPYQSIPVNSKVTAVAAGGNHTCAVVDGGARCWGDNQNGQVGDPNSFAARADAYPVFQPGSKVSKIAAGSSHTCAIVDGGVQCWGANYRGQLGAGYVGNPSPLPVPSDIFVANFGVTDIAAAGDHTCVTAQNQLFCWGGDENGELGVGTLDDWSFPSSPKGLEYGSGMSTSIIAAGYSSTCAVSSGVLRCWGSNHRGALGIAIVDYRTLAAPVKTSDVIFASRMEIKP
jgi:alpha-tubulin suppressor-like RCC1 family protein